MDYKTEFDIENKAFEIIYNLYDDYAKGKIVSKSHKYYTPIRNRIEDLLRIQSRNLLNCKMQQEIKIKKQQKMQERKEARQKNRKINYIAPKLSITEPIEDSALDFNFDCGFNIDDYLI
jgi:hypothetical protein